MNTIYIGIGASAGGMESFLQFLDAFPETENYAIFLVQHLSPEHESIRREWIKTHTDMEIVEAENMMQSHGGCIYLIPPRVIPAIQKGIIQLKVCTDGQYEHYAPVDQFLQSLAYDQGKKAAAIILSGTGSDGTEGVLAIKEQGGLVIVQHPDSADFTGMPQNAIAAGAADYVLYPQDMYRVIQEQNGGNLNHIFEDIHHIHPAVQKNLSRISMIMWLHSNIDFSDYKEQTLLRRIQRRMAVNRMDDMQDYIRLLESFGQEREILLNELLIGVTSFFRDAEAFEVLEQKVLPNLDYRKEQIRIWSAGTSSGEEVYSLAILFQQYLSSHNYQCQLKLFATDIDEEALYAARKGIYSSRVAEDLDQSILNQYFVKNGNEYQVCDEIRKKVTFSFHNIIKDPPITRMDLIVCRNLFIYLKAEIQQTILDKFSCAFNQDGYLFLGSSEAVSGMDAFTAIDSKWKIYQFRQKLNGAFYRSAALEEELFPSAAPKYLKNRQVSVLKSDLSNLVRDLDAGVLFLDIHLRIRSLTSEVTCLTGITSADTGRSIWDIPDTGRYSMLAEDAAWVLEMLENVEKILEDGYKTWKVRIRPYRIENNAVDGVIFTMTDITEMIQEQYRVRMLQGRLDNTMKISNSAWWEYEILTGKVRYSPGKATMLGYTVEAFPNDVYQICQYIHPDDYDKTMEAMRQYLEGKSREWNLVYRMRCSDDSYLWVHDVGHVSEWTKEGKPKKLIGSVIDFNISGTKE